MKTSLYTAIAALGLMGTTHADTGCGEYTYYGSYLGAHWNGDASTFGNRHMN